MGGSDEAVGPKCAPEPPRGQQQRQQQALRHTNSSSSPFGESYSYPVPLLSPRTQLPQLQEVHSNRERVQQQHHQEQLYGTVEISKALAGDVQQQLLLQSRLPRQGSFTPANVTSISCALEEKQSALWLSAAAPSAAPSGTPKHAGTAVRDAVAPAKPASGQTAKESSVLAYYENTVPDRCRLAADRFLVAGAAATADELRSSDSPASTPKTPSGQLQHATETGTAAEATAATTATDTEGPSMATVSTQVREQPVTGASQGQREPPLPVTDASAAEWKTPVRMFMQTLQKQATYPQHLQQLSQLQQPLCRPSLPVPAAPPPQICLIGPRLLAMRSPWGLSTSAVLQRNGINELLLYLSVLQSLLLPARWGGLMPLGAADCLAGAAALPAAAAAAAAVEGLARAAAAAEASFSSLPSQLPQQLLLSLPRRFLQQVPTATDGSSGLTQLNGLYRHLRTTIQKQQQQGPIWGEECSLVAQAAAAATAAAESAAELGLEGEDAAAWPAVAAAIAAVEATAAAAAAAASAAAAPALLVSAATAAKEHGSPATGGEAAAGVPGAAVTAGGAVTVVAGEGNSFDSKRRESLRQLGRLLTSPPVIVIFDIYSRGGNRRTYSSISTASRSAGSSKLQSSCPTGDLPRTRQSSPIASSNRSSVSSSLTAEFGEAFGWQILEFSLTEVGAPPLQVLVDFCSSLRFWLQLDRHLNLALVNVHPKSGCGALLLLACAAMACSSSTGTTGWGTQHQLLKMLGNASVAAQECAYPADNLRVGSCGSASSSNPNSNNGSSYQRGGGVLHWKSADRWPPSCLRYLSYFETLLRQHSVGLLSLLPVQNCVESKVDY